MNVVTIQNKIYEIRGIKMMLDFDFAEMYEVEMRVLDQAIKRNLENFPDDFMFQLTADEWSYLGAVNISSNPSAQFVMMDLPKNRTAKYLPYAFAEHGINMLASV